MLTLSQDSRAFWGTDWKELSFGTEITRCSFTQEIIFLIKLAKRHYIDKYLKFQKGGKQFLCSIRPPVFSGTVQDFHSVL